jgi:predicted DNA-binding transcriptional regulator AlpA
MVPETATVLAASSLRPGIKSGSIRERRMACQRVCRSAIGRPYGGDRVTTHRTSKAVDRLLDAKEAAAMLAVKPATLYQWAYQRRLPVVKLFGPRGALRFRLSDIEQLIAPSLRPALRSVGDDGLFEKRGRVS